MLRIAVLVVLAVAAALALLTNVPTPDPPSPTPSRGSATQRPVVAIPPQDPVAAAACFLTSLTPAVLLDSRRLRSLLGRWVDPSARTALEQTYAAEADRVRFTYGGAPLVSRSALLGYRLVPAGPGRLDVAIWAVGIATGPLGTSSSGWSTVTVSMRRRGAEWRVLAVDATPGPGPSLAARRLAHAAAAFRPFSYAR